MAELLTTTPLSIEQIKQMIQRELDLLQYLQGLPEYQALENNEHFTTSNDLKLGDAVQALSEIYDGISYLEECQIEKP